MADENNAEHEYKSEYRGRVQNRATGLDAQPMYHLSFAPMVGDVHTYHAFAQKVEAFNAAHPQPRLYVVCGTAPMDEAASRRLLQRVDSLTAVVGTARGEQKLAAALLQRAVAETVAQNYEGAISDLEACLGIDSTSVVALWQRAYCQTMMPEFDNKTRNVKGDATAASLKSARIVADLDLGICTTTVAVHTWPNATIYMPSTTSHGPSISIIVWQKPTTIVDWHVCRTD